ncbi:hypothetical protein WN51_13714 [Melipona quadrifasciata]|uniref:Uncharacterized protein n=1 Tax=Melipona quadrifasciata TaxID=166423 RepID=A0A0M8ZYQ3_9HYME|nr:hypothetical protein WN51_13714 [Melipona quadrifasciata]
MGKICFEVIGLGTGSNVVKNQPPLLSLPSVRRAFLIGFVDRLLAFSLGTSKREAPKVNSSSVVIETGVDIRRNI